MGEMTRDQVLQRVRRNEKLERADLRGIDLSRAALTGAMLSRAAGSKGPPFTPTSAMPRGDRSDDKAWERPPIATIL